jgi:hypothetical protein
MADIAATLDGSDIDFTVDRVISGLTEYRQAALSRVSNDVSYVDADYGLDLAGEIGQTGRTSTIGIRASSAIMNDQRFTSAALTNTTIARVDDVESVALSFDVVAEDGTDLSLTVLIEAGEVALVP